MNSRFFRYLVLTVLLIGSSCSNNKTELNIIGEALPPLESLGRMARDYEQRTGVKVIVHPYEFETALEKTQLDFLSGAPQYDIIMGIFYNHGRYYENGYIYDYDYFKNDPELTKITVPESDFYPALQEVVMHYKGKTVAYPFSAQTMFLWYRKDLFQNSIELKAFVAKYGYELRCPDENNPLTWKEYYDIAEFFTRKKGERLAGTVLDAPFYGTTLQMKRHPCSFYEFTNFVFSFGGKFFENDGKPVIDSPQNVKALQYYLSLKKFCPEGVTQFTWDDALAQMQQGKIAMTIMWSDAPSALYDTLQSKVVNKIGYSLIPIDPQIGKKVSVFGGWGFMINKKSKHAKQAYEFIQWACRPDIQLKWAKQGGLPASKAIFEDKEYLAIPYMRAQNEALKNLVAWPREPWAENFITDGIIAISKAGIEENTPEESLRWLQKKYENLSR